MLESVLYITCGATIPITSPATVAPRFLKVERDVLSTGSAVTTEAIEPYGIFVAV